MTVGIDKLLRMAEQIAANISISEDTEDVAQQVAGHLQRFWDPRMRARFMAEAPGHVEQMSPIVRRVLKLMTAAAQTG